MKLQCEIQKGCYGAIINILKMWYMIAGITSIFLFIKLYNKLTTGWCYSRNLMTGKVVIITGANSGIGYETALNLAKRGATLVLACRDEKKGITTVENIIKRTNNKSVTYEKVDLSSLKSVRDFSERVKSKLAKIDVLINNAGVAGFCDKKTEDNIIYDMQVNYFGPFLLTLLLLPLLKEADYSRIVNVSSTQHRRGEIDFKTINKEKTGHFAPLTVYSNAKLCTVLFTQELSRRLKDTNITVNSLHPGHVKTSIHKNTGRIIETLIHFWLRLFCKTPKEGAQTSIYLAVSEDVDSVSGRYFEECKESRSVCIDKVEVLAEQLWKYSEDLVNLKWDELDMCL